VCVEIARKPCFFFSNTEDSKLVVKSKKSGVGHYPTPKPFGIYS
jgi:hypothetical protein